MVLVARLADYAPDEEFEVQEEKSISRRAVRSKEVQNVNDTLTDPDYKKSNDTDVHASELVAPLVDEGMVIGIIDVYFPTPNAFTDDDVRRIRDLAALTVTAIKRADQFAASQRTATELVYVRQLQDRLNLLFAQGGEDVVGTRHDILLNILNWANEQTTSKLGLFLLAESSGEKTELIVKEHVGPWDETLDRWDISEGITGRAYRTRTPQVSPDVTKDPKFIAAFAGVRSDLAIPLVRGNEVLGVLDVESDRPHHYTREHAAWGTFLGTASGSRVDGAGLGGAAQA